MIRVAVVGAGLIGRERLLAVQHLASTGKPVVLQGIFDLNAELARKVAIEFNTIMFDSLGSLMESSPDWIVIALPHEVAVGVAETALKGPSRVIMEKPMGRDLREAKKLLDLGGSRLHIGLNYRFYEGISKALQDAKRGRFGKLIAADLFLGHGCCPGQEKTWRLNDAIAGGGCLIDPGVHLLDLCLQLAPGGVQIKGGTSWRGFWNTGIEEDVSLLLTSESFAINVRVSKVNWRSTFSMRLNGTEGYGMVSGRGRSYGKQTYTVGPRWGWQHASSQLASEIIEIETDGNNAFIRETLAILFPDANPNGLWPTSATAAEAFRSMKLLDDIRDFLNLRRIYSQ